MDTVAFKTAFGTGIERGVSPLRACTCTVVGEYPFCSLLSLLAAFTESIGIGLPLLDEDASEEFTLGKRAPTLELFAWSRCLARMPSVGFAACGLI
jgi:hypothetical protein